MLVELQAILSWGVETEQRMGQIELATEQSERAMGQMERMIEEMKIENRKKINIGKEINQKYKK